MMKKPWEIEHDEDTSQEGGMAVSNLKRVNEMSEELMQLIDPTDSLPGWIQAKLTTVFEDLNDVHGYMTSLTEAKKKKGLWANIWARRKAGKRPKRPGEKGYPKTLDIGESEEEKTLREAIGLIIKTKR